MKILLLSTWGNYILIKEKGKTLVREETIVNADPEDIDELTEWAYKHGCEYIIDGTVGGDVIEV